MSLYATKWVPCTAEEYHKIYNDRLHVYASYTNHDGSDGLSYQPQIYTSWGDDEKELIRCEASRERDGNGGFTPWEYKHSIAIDWDDKD